MHFMNRFRSTSSVMRWSVFAKSPKNSNRAHALYLLIDVLLLHIATATRGNTFQQLRSFSRQLLGLSLKLSLFVMANGKIKSVTLYSSRIVLSLVGR